MEDQFQSIGIPIRRVSAVNGFAENGLVSASVAPYGGLPKGEIGCFESHRKAWKVIVEESLPGAFVLEDDVVVSSDFGRISFDDNILDKYDVIKLDTCRWLASYGEKIGELCEGRDLRKLLGSETSAGCYFVTLAGAHKLLRRTQCYFEPVDTMMFNLNSKLFYELNTLKVIPSMAAQLRFIMDGDQLPGEAAESLQLKRSLKTDLRPTVTVKRKLRLYGRRLRDWDFSAMRRLRQMRHLQHHKPTVGPKVIPFWTASEDHINAALPVLKSYEP